MALEKKARRNSAITMVEVLVASTVLSMFVFFGYKVFFAVSNSFQKGNWSLATQNRLRNGLNLVREEMQKASYESRVQMSGTFVTKDNYEFCLNTNENIAGDALVARWFIGIPYRTIGGVSSGAVFQSELRLTGGRLLYSKIAVLDDDPSERKFNNYLIAENVVSLNLIVTPFDIDRPLAATLVTLDIEVEHPDRERHPNARVRSETGAKIEVEVLRNL